MADEPIDIFLAGEVGVFYRRGVQRHALTLVSLTSEHTLGEMIRLAIERDHDLFSLPMNAESTAIKNLTSPDDFE